MDAVALIKDRRSIRKYTDEKVDRKVIEDIVEIARFAPSWVNFQIARYTIVDNDEMLSKISDKGLYSFAYNMDTLKNAKGVAVLSFVQGKSGKYEDQDYDGNKWEIFDAGIACQTFCLAAHAKGIGTCIFGVMDAKNIAEIVNLPEDETVAAIIVYGYPAETPSAPPRKEVNELMRFAD